MDHNYPESQREGADVEYANQDLLEVEELTPLERFAKVFSSPREAFAGLLGSSTKGGIIIWGMVFTIISALFGVVATSSNPEVRQKQIDAQMERFEKQHDAGEITDAQYESIQETLEAQQNSNMTLVFGLIGAFVFAPIFLLIFAAIFYAVSRVLQTDQDSRLNFKTAFAAFLLAGVVSTFGILIQFLGVYFTSDPKFAPDVTAFASTGSGVLDGLLHLTNPFTLWAIFLSGLAISIIAKTSQGKATVVWGAIMAVLLMIGGVLQSMFGMA